jgi:phosphosulfolactate synthase
MNSEIFNLTQLPERPVRPRDNGLTMVMDKGLSIREALDFIEHGSHLTDLLKLGFGTAYVTPKLKEKIEHYKRAGFKVYFGGKYWRKTFQKTRYLVRCWCTWVSIHE